MLVTSAGAAARHPSKFVPHEVALAIEVVSPTSVTMDRVTKTDLYAQAGIPFYWRVETLREIVVHVQRLDADACVYRPAGQFARTVKVDEPWEIAFPVSRITPRHFRRDRQ